MSYISDTLSNLVNQTAFFNLSVGNYVMIVVACIFLYLAIKKEYEPLLLVPIAFGMLLVNIYPDIILSAEESSGGAAGLLHWVRQHSWVSMWLTSWQFSLDSTEKLRQRFLSSAELTDRRLFSWPASWGRHR